MSISKTVSCTGCTACMNVCPQKSISMDMDGEGFYYPHVDAETCIDCNLCNKVCIKDNIRQFKQPIRVLGCRIIDNNELLTSSSGGMFGLLAAAFIKSGGRVFAACFDKNNMVCHDELSSIEHIDSFRRSKYAQSHLGNVFKKIKIQLNFGKKVLFVGTPCQVAGLLAFLRKSYDNLFCVDFVCHGVPSPGVWQEYLKSLGNGISNINFRDKVSGWPNYSFSYSKNGIKIKQTVSENPYMRGFLHDLYLRPSCYECKFKGFSSGADLTLSDFWGVWKIYPKWNDQKGAGIIAVNSAKGINLLDNIDNNKYEKTDLTLQQAYIDYNNSAYHCAFPNPKRKIFFSRFRKEPLVPLIRELSKDSILVRIKNIISKVKHNFT